MRLRSALLCVALLAAQASAFSAPPIPVAAFAHEDQYSNPKLAPDGKRIAITVRVPGGERFIPVVMVFSLPDMQRVGAIRMPVFEVPVDYAWVSNNRLAIEKGREFGSREAPQATGEVLAVDADGTHQEYLYGYDMWHSSRRGERYGDDYAYGYIEGIPRDLNGHLLLTSHAWKGNHSLLYDIDSTSAIRALLADLPAPDLGFVMQENGTPRFAHGTGEDSYAILFRHNDSTSDWEKISGKFGRRYVPFNFSADDTEFIARFSKDGGPDTLIKENLATGQRTTLFEDPVASYTGLLYGSRRGLPFGARSTIGKPQARYFDADSDGARLHKMLAAQFPDHYLHFVSFSDDGNLVLFSVASDRDPGSYYLLNRKTMKADLLFSALETIDPALMAERRPVSFKARDGLDLYGYLTMPNHAPGTKVPLVLMPHGGPHGIFDGWFFDEDAQFLASRGYAVLQVNYRGSGGRGLDFEEAGFRQWAGKIQDDLVDGVKWTVAQGEVDGGRMCVYGASFGGYSALMLAAREPSLFRCAVGYAGVYDLKLLAKPENNRSDTFKANYLKKVIGDDIAVLDRNSPVTLAAQIKAPVLLVHGGNDKRAPVKHAEEMRDALTAAGHAPEWFLAPNEGHGFYDTKNRIEFYQKLEAFMAANLGH